MLSKCTEKLLLFCLVLFLTNGLLVYTNPKINVSHRIGGQFCAAKIPSRVLKHLALVPKAVWLQWCCLPPLSTQKFRTDCCEFKCCWCPKWYSKVPHVIFPPYLMKPFSFIVCLQMQVSKPPHTEFSCFSWPAQALWSCHSFGLCFEPIQLH